MLLSNSESIIFKDPGSVFECVDLLENFSGIALGERFDAWTYVDFFDREQILKTLSYRYKTIRSGAVVEDQKSISGAPVTFCLQNLVPIQPVGIVITKVRSLVPRLWCLVFSSVLSELCTYYFARLKGPFL